MIMFTILLIMIIMMQKTTTTQASVFKQQVKHDWCMNKPINGKYTLAEDCGLHKISGRCIVNQDEHATAICIYNENELEIDGIRKANGLLPRIYRQDFSQKYRLFTLHGGGILKLNHVIVSGGANLGNSEKALVHRADLDVNLDLMVLKSNEGKSKTGVAAEPELKGNVERGLRESLTGGADRVGDIGTGASSGDLSELGVGKVGKLGSVTNHLVETVLLLGSKSKLVPDVHPVTVLSVDALTTDLNLNHRDELVSGVVEPSGVFGIVSVNLGESNLKVCSVSQVTVS